MINRKFQPVVPEDLYHLRQLSIGDLSQDGEWLAVVISEPDRKSNRQYSQIWLMPAHRGVLQQFTFGEHHDSQPRFSPDGKLLAFLSDRSGSSQVHLMRVSGGESWQLSHLPGNVLDYSWAPDGDKLCLVVSPKSAESGKDAKAPLVHHFTNYGVQPPHPSVELYLVNVKSGRSNLLLRDDQHNVEPVFSPDGAWIVFCSQKHSDKDLKYHWPSLRRINTRDGKPERVKSHPGAAQSPAISPDGKWIAFYGHADPAKGWSQVNTELCVVPFTGGPVRYLSSELDRPVQNIIISDCFALWQSQPPLWSPDSNSLYAILTDRSKQVIYRFNLQKGPPEVIVDEPGAVLNFRIDFSTDLIHYTQSSTANPCELFTRPLTGSLCTQRTRLNQWTARRELAQLRALPCPAGDGPALEGWLLLPPGFTSRRKYPGILYIHGGPSSAYGPVFMHEFHYLAGRGFVVFFCNPRGSQGYGQDFAGAIYRDWGNLDYLDLMRFTDRVLEQCQFIDPGRLGVTGGSYGGYMTNWIIGHTQRFKAAVTQRSVSNMLYWIFGRAV